VREKIYQEWCFSIANLVEMDLPLKNGPFINELVMIYLLNNSDLP
jgi:hypothetical protein